MALTGGTWTGENVETAEGLILLDELTLLKKGGVRSRITPPFVLDDRNILSSDGQGTTQRTGMRWAKSKICMLTKGGIVYVKYLWLG